MLKLPRFVKEYANFSINSIKANKLMKECFKMEKIKKIEKAVSLAKRGMITIEECMKIISET